MKQCLPILILLFACQQNQETPTQAKVLLPEVVSSPLPEFSTSVNVDGTEIFFNRTNENRSAMQILVTTKSGDNWSDPVSLPFSEGKYIDVDPFLTHDNNRLYFSSNRPLADSLEAGEFNTWYIDRLNNSWSDPILSSRPLNSDSTEIFISMTKNGNAYFVSERDSGRYIMKSTFRNGFYEEAEPVILKYQSKPIYASNPCIASDESFLIVAVRVEPSIPPDLFVSWNMESGWSELHNLGDLVNTPEYAEFAPGLSKDDQTLFFTSERPGMAAPVEEGIRPPGDIYSIDLSSVFENLEK
ncbi:hypothetical protein [Ekhidna sp. To15]|uniref:hypothetical protein n=1 Tax=Ekhidna sp. To15 TaxID=3395267 RepID=UPI003F5218DE